MDKITRQVRIEHWTQIMNECLNSGMNKTEEIQEELEQKDQLIVELKTQLNESLTLNEKLRV